jgi:uncharacterized repeat protein (TIGR01451 family)
MRLLFAFRRLVFGLLALLCLCLQPATASVLVSQTFANTTAPGWVFGGTNFTACLSDNCAGDTSPNGWLRLTNTGGNEEGYAYYNTAFASGQGFVVDFDFASWGGSGADGIVLFLQDASQTFTPGAVGGSFSYAGDCTGTTQPAGMTGAWIGVAFDEWGNFMNPSDRCKNGGPGQTPASVSVRGPAPNYSYVTGAQAATAMDCPASNPGLSGPTPNLCTTRPTTGTNFRHARIVLLYTGTQWQGSAYVQFGSAAGLTQILPTSTWASTAPTNLRIGFAASTGGSTNYHEIRNLVVTNPVDNSIVKTVSAANVVHGSNFNYVLTVANANYSASTSTVVSDPLPTTNATYQSYAVSGALTTSNAGGATTCSFVTPNLTCTVGTLPVSSTGVITVTMLASGTGTTGGTAVSNTATVSQADADINLPNNTSTVSFNLYAAPTLSVVKVSSVFSDPVHATTNPKSIPGAIATYGITVTNSGPGQVDSNTLVFADAIPANTSLYIGDIGAVGSGPVVFANGATSSGMTYTYTSLASTTDNVDFSKDNGVTWTYVPVSDGTGFDSTVTNIRVRPQGVMAAAGAGNPSFSISFRVRIK